MLHTCAVKLVDQIFLHCALPTEKRAIYIYGVELGCSTLWTCTFILLLSFLLGQALNCILFLGVFISLRLFAGGYHAETYRNSIIVFRKGQRRAIARPALPPKLENGLKLVLGTPDWT